MLDALLANANKYAEGFKNVMDRRNQWLDKHKEVRDHLKEIANYLNEHANYKPGFFVDTNHAFNEEINGTCANLPSLTLRSGNMPLDIRFRNAGGAQREYIEEGFHITFTPTITGEVLVLLLPHFVNGTGERPGFVELAIIESPAGLTPQILETLVARAIESAFYTSFTGVIEQQHMQQNDEQTKYQHAPIGFKRFESTEKIN